MGGLCKQSLDHPVLGLPWQKKKKKALLGPRSRLQVGAQGVLPTGAEHSADRPRLESSLLQSKRDGRAVWRLAGRSLGVWESSLGAGPQGPMPLQKTSQPGLPSQG